MELAQASVMMKKQGNLSYPEFCTELEKQGLSVEESEIEAVSRLMEYIGKNKLEDLKE